MRIYLVGSPGTGKTTIRNELHNLLKNSHQIESYEIKDILARNNLLLEYEEKRDTHLFDLEPSTEVVQNFLIKKKSFIISGPILPFNKLIFDFIIVLICSKSKMQYNRLSKRNYKKTKIDENIESELLGEPLGNVLDWISEYNFKIDPIIHDTCKNSLDENLKEILQIINPN